MKYIPTVFVILFVALSLNAQQKYVTQWSETLDNGGYDYARGVAVDVSGNVYVTGESNYGSGYNYLTVKYDSLGNIIWADTLDNGSGGNAYGIAVDGSGNVYVTGYSYIGSNDADYLTVKYDSLGNIVWADTLDNGGTDDAYGIAVDGSGNVYVTGYSKIDSNDDYLTVKYDSLGNIIWADTLDNGNFDGAYGVAVDGSGNVYVTGYSYIGSNDADYLTVKYDSLGNMVWADTLDNSAWDYARGIAVDGSGNVYVTGESYIDVKYDYLTVKYDSLGNILWSDTLDNSSDDEAYGVAVDNSGNVYVTGYSDNGSNDDYLTVKYDSLGNMVWADTLDNGSNDKAYGVAVDGSGNIYVTGISNNGSNNDYLTVKYAKYKDAGILSIVSSDTVEIDSNYTPVIWVKNNSYEDTFNFNITAYIDSTGTNMYADSQSVSALAAGDSVLVGFSTWTVPSNPMDLNLSFSIITSDMNPENDTISKTLYVRDMTPPVIDSAVAFDGTNHQPGIDNDDYIILYFSEPTNKPVIDSSNIDNVLSLSSGHTWLDGAGNIGTCIWNANGDQLQINLTTNTSLPTIAVGDTITPDSSTITDVNGNPCSSPVILGGTFGVYIDAAILSIVSPDTVDGGSNYTPSIYVKNNSYDNTLSFDVASYIDSAGSVIYADTQHVANLASGDSLLINFAQWTAPNDSIQMQLRFALLTSDMDSTNDTLSETLFVKHITGIASKMLERKTSFNVSGISTGKILYKCYMAKAGDYDITLYNLNGTVLKDIRGTGVGYKEGIISKVSSGVYFMRFKSGKYSINRKVILIK